MTSLLTERFSASSSVREIRAADGDLAWGSLIADVVHDDRGERVGGTRHPRPIVAVH
jgi:hypothetical protein